MNAASTKRGLLRHYLDFGGRARRSEFWWFCLAAFALWMTATALDWSIWKLTGAEAFFPISVQDFVETASEGPDGPTQAFRFYGFGDGLLGSLTKLVLLVPALAVAVRRLHDTDSRGWWLLLVLVPLIGWIILLVWYCWRGTAGPNRFGPEPVAALPGPRDD